MVFDDEMTKLGADGALTITVQTAVVNVYRIEPWDRYLNCSIRKGSEWKPHREEVMMPIVNIGLPADSNHGRFVASIPQDIVKAIGPIQHWQFALLQWASMDQRAADLIKSAPILLWLLYHHSKKFPEKWDDQRWFNVLDLKRHEIFHEIFGWSSKSAIRVLGKIKLSNGGIRDLHAVYYFCLDEENIKKAVHMRVVPMHLLMVIRKHTYSVRGKFFDKFKEEFYPGGVKKAVADAKHFLGMRKETYRIARMFSGIESGVELSDEERFKANKILHKVSTCSSIEQLHKMHDQLISRINMKRDRKYLEVMRNRYSKFPQPPFAGTDTIQPINNIDLLLSEGREMHHCVASYAERIMRRRCYIYKVCEPERATLEIEFRKGSPRIAQFKLKHNHAPSQESWMVVRRWVNEARKELGDEVLQVDRDFSRRERLAELL